MAAVNRWFVRCLGCLSVAAVTEEPPKPRYMDDGSYRVPMDCAACGGRIEVMGRVRRDRLVTTHTECACDDRCTSARGPMCNCVCGGANHGTYAVVTIIRDRGPVPQVSVLDPEAAVARRAEYEAAVAPIRERVAAYRVRRQAGEFLPGGAYDEWMRLQKVLATAAKAKQHKTRMKHLKGAL